MYVVVENASTRFSDADAQTATRAIAHQVRYHAGPAWGVHAPPVVFAGHLGALAPVPPGSYVLGLFDTDDQPDALGWHTEGDDGSVFGRVNVGAVLDNGGTPLTGPLTVASVLSHEVLEALIDPQVNRWAQAPDGRLFAVEVGDPVESTSYTIKVGAVGVDVSDFVFPAWFDDYRGLDVRTHWADTGLVPFTLDRGGYAVVWSPGGQPTQMFGDSYPDWRRAMKSSPLARTARRIASAV